MKKPFSESELLKDLDAHSAHADELAQPLGQELTPLERLRDSVKRYNRPTDPVWDEFYDGEEMSEDLVEERDQPSPDGLA